MVFQYRLVATGGTFDRFHKGHAALLDKAFSVGEKVIIGVSSQKLVWQEKKLLGRQVLPYQKRVADVLAFLKKRNYCGRQIITPLNDIFGPTVLNDNLEAIVCTRETRKGAIAINKARKKHGKKKAVIVECPFITSADRRHISSTRIRLGEINREGEILVKNNFGRFLPLDLRITLKKPIDQFFLDEREVLNELRNSVMLITVGDFIFAKMQNLGIRSDVAVIDFKINRSPIKKNVVFISDRRVFNQAGTISPKLIHVLKKAIKDKIKFNRRTIIEVIGEEDLAVIPAILTAPLGTIILYGQPAYRHIPNGLVRVLVTEEKKQWAVNWLKTFKN